MSFILPNDGADGELRDFAAHRCGGHEVLQRLIDSGAVIAYEANNQQYIRVPTHRWDNKVGVSVENSIAGVTHSPDGAALNDLAESFTNMITKFAAPGQVPTMNDNNNFDIIPSIEWLQPSDTRVANAHSQALVAQRNAINTSSVRIEDIGGILGSDSRYPPPK